MLQALLISVIGMGLVFGAILLLWLFMELVVRFTADRPVDDVQVEHVTMDGAPHVPQDKKRIAAAATAAAIQLRKQQAAATATAVALAKADQVKKKPTPGEVPSSWQPVMRALQRKERSGLFNRKSKGSIG